MELIEQARALYRAGEMHDALEAAQAACDRHPREADAWWLLACISRHTAMPAASDDAFRRAAQLSRRHRIPWRVEKEVFQQLVEAARQALSVDARRRLERARVVVDSLPDAALTRQGVLPDALTYRRREPVDLLTLFQVNFENRSADAAELTRLLGRTLARA